MNRQTFMTMFGFVACIWLVFGVFYMSLCGCDPEPTQLKCDYCRRVRDGAYRYMCEKCKGSHVACEAERAMLIYHREGEGRFQHWSATTIQTVGSKGYDGFTLAVVIGDP